VRVGAGLAVPGMIGGAYLAWRWTRPSRPIAIAPPAPSAIVTPEGLVPAVTLASGTF
jgi:hypothetical protein